VAQLHFFGCGFPPGVGILTIFLRLETARIGDGRIQIDAGISGRLGQQEHVIDYLQEEIRLLKH
jgi:hypothetical protein